MRIIVKFLKIVYTGILRYCYSPPHALVLAPNTQRAVLARDLDPVYMTLTRRKLIGNHALASFTANSLNEIIPSDLTSATHETQTRDCMHSRRKFMLKYRPDTTNCCATHTQS